jgi:signal transduction histidine kinase
MANSLEERDKERARFEQEIIRQNRDLSALNAIIATVSSSLELPEILETLKGLLVDEFKIPGGVIYFYDQSQDRLNLEGAWGVPASVLSGQRSFRVPGTHYEQVVAHQEPFSRQDFNQVDSYSKTKLSQTRPAWGGYLCVPLLAKGEVQGVLEMFSLRPKVIDDSQIRALSALGQQVGMAIHNARLFNQVQVGQRRLKRLSQELLEVQEAERRHIARELHDEIGQALTAMKVNLQTIQHLKGGSNLAPLLGESIEIAERTLQQVRDLSLDLRPSLLDDLGVVAALRWYIDRQAQRAGFEARFEPEVGLDGERLPSELETTCFRVVQEALTNIVRHAQAEHVDIRLCQDEDRLELDIYDDGIGFDVSEVIDRASGDLSMGLLGMQERVQLIGGSIQITSDPDKGTKIRARFPITPQFSAGKSAVNPG